MITLAVGCTVLVAVNVVVWWRIYRRRRAERRAGRARGILGRLVDGPDKGSFVVISLDGPATVMRIVDRDERPLTIEAFVNGRALGTEKLIGIQGPASKAEGSEGGRGWFGSLPCLACGEPLVLRAGGRHCVNKHCSSYVPVSDVPLGDGVEDVR